MSLIFPGAPSRAQPGQEAASVAAKASLLPCCLSVPPRRLRAAALVPWTPVPS